MRATSMRATRWLGALAALALLASACSNTGDDDEGGVSVADIDASARDDLGTGVPTGDNCENVSVDAPGVSDDEIKVGGIVGETNPTGNPYEDAELGTQAYFDRVNARGGVCGRDINQIDAIDDQSAPSRNILAARDQVEEEGVFAVIPVVTQTFQGAEYLGDQGVPTFGWNINAEWAGPENLFGEKGSFICFQGIADEDCIDADLPWVAQQVGVTSVGVIAYGTSPQSSACGDGVRLSFEAYSDFTGQEFVFEDTSLAFGQQDFSPAIDVLRESGAEMVFTCVDAGANLRFLEAIQDEGLDTAMYWPNGYDQEFLDEFADRIENDVYTGVQFRPFEAPPSPGLQAYLEAMDEDGYPINEYTLVGWSNADLFVSGVRGAGPDFDQASTSAAINSFTDYTAGGIWPPQDWATLHDAVPMNCTAYMQIVDDEFVSISDDVDLPWVCFDYDSPDPTEFEFRTFGEEDIVGELPDVETAGPSGGGDGEEAGEPPADPEAAELAIGDLLVAYFQAPTPADQIAVIANGDSIAASIEATFTEPIALPANVEVTFTSPTTADVAFSPEIGGEVLDVALSAFVVEIDGEWLMHPFAACDLVSQTDAAEAAVCLAGAEAP